MAKDRQSKGENVRVKSNGNHNLLSHYHDCSTRVFYDGGRANEYLHNLFLKAAKNGEEERIRNFLVRSTKNGNMNVNYKDEKTGNTAVVLAASRNHVKIVKMLLDYGADITLFNDQGQSIFDFAPDSIIPMLLASVERQGVSNRHVLQAAWQGNLQILQRLLSSQADIDVNCKNADGMTPLLLVTRDVNLFEKIERNVAEKGYNPLEVVKELLQHNADCSITASDGKSPLHYITHNKGPNAQNMANLIIKDTNSQLELPDKTSSLPIHLASSYDNVPVLIALINGGANVNSRGLLGQTPLHVAAAQGHERCSTTLLDNGADVTMVDDHGNSPVDVSKSRNVKMVLKEAWVEQTSDYSVRPFKRSYSAPTELLTETEIRLPENVPHSILPLKTAEKQTSPRKISAENNSSALPDVNQSIESPVPHPPKTKTTHIKRSVSLTKVSRYGTPRPPKISPNDGNRTKYKTQTKQISSSSTNAGLGSRQATELPKLSIQNIELQLGSLYSDVPFQPPHNRYGSIQRFRLLNNTSAVPLTPNRYQHGCSSRMSDSSSSQGTERLKLPKTLAPLSCEGRTSSVDTRQVCSRVSSHTGHEFVGNVFDLDNFQSNSSCHTSLAKIFAFNSEAKDIVGPPSSPCEDSGLQHISYPVYPGRDNELENKTYDKQLESDHTGEPCTMNVNEGGKCCHENIISNDELVSAQSEESKENKSKELKSTENQEVISTCNDCLQNSDCDVNDCYKTQTFSATNLSKFWIPCSKNGEASTGTTDGVNNIELENSNPKKNTNMERESTKIKNKTGNGKEGTEILDGTRKEDSSVSFYVEFGDSKIEDSVKCLTCGNNLDNKKSTNCEECTNRVPQKKTFWISLDGETSDGETDDTSATKKCVDRKVDSCKAERFSRRARSLPEKTCINLNVEDDEEVLREKFLTVYSEDTFILQRRSLADSRNEALENDNEDLVNPDMGICSEDTFIIEKNPQENDGKPLSKKDLNQGLTRGKVNACSEVGIEPNTDVKVAVQGDTQQQVGNELKSSIVLQSLSMGDDEPHNEQCEENTCTKNTNLPSGGEVSLPSGEEVVVVSQSDSSKKTEERHYNDASVFLKSAWSSDGIPVDKPLGVQICNAFPSPVPPINTKPEVQPPIGSCSGKTKPRKTNSGKPKRKVIAKESKKDGKNNMGKEQKSSGKKGKSGKKVKGKKIKPTFKEISVNQSFRCVDYDNDVPSSGPCEFSEYMQSPDMDQVPTLSIDSRTTNKLLRGKFPTLSPIPESPRSLLLTPTTEEVEVCSSESSIHSHESLEKRTLELNGLLKPKEIQTETIVEEKLVTGNEDSDGDFISIVNDTDQDAQVEFSDEGADEVDSGRLSRLFNMCMPRLKIISSDSDSDSDSEAQAIGNDSDGSDDDDDDTDSHSNINTTYPNEQLRFPVDEADQDVEKMLQNILADNDDQDKKNTDSSQEQLIGGHLEDNHGLPDQGTTVATHDSNALPSKPNNGNPTNNDHELDKERNENIELKETRTRSNVHVDQITDILPWEFYSPDDVFIQHGNADEGSLVSSLNDEEKTSDNDSSYISCDSTSRGVSDCSTNEGYDSYFSSQESFHGMTLSTHDDTTNGSVDINIHEQLHKPQTSITSRSSSNDSRSISVCSDFPSNSRGVARSQVCSESDSLSSTTSCGGEIQWQKGNILGKGGFGTVWLGLVNTGELIAVKQVELNHKDESEAEKQYEKLQEEVSLLKSLRHHNIVKYIGTCLDDNSTVNIFMEFVPGGSIAQALKRFGAFVEPVFQRYTKQILSGVEYLHGKNVVHRDIKGGNIMLMRNGVIKLIDFGCAKRLCMNLSLSRSSVMHSMKGTPYWMAPEVIEETSGQGTKSDIWSIGCTVYEMATGSPPWSHMPPIPALFAIGNGSDIPQLGNTFSKSARDFTAACMTREPSARPSASDLLQHEFITELR